MIEGLLLTTAFCLVVIWLVEGVKNRVVARSTVEAELRSMASGLCELMWLRLLLTKLQMYKGGSLQLYCDNHATINIVNNPVHHDRTKNIEIDRHFIRDILDEGALQVNFVKSGD